MEHEFVTIPAFHRLPINSKGSLGYVLGNVPYIAYSEGIDDMRLMQGQSVPCSANRAELINPFSFAAKVQIVRGAPVNFSAGYAFDTAKIGKNMIQNRAGASLFNVLNGGDAAGRRRGVGLIAKRGVYNVNFRTQAGTTAASNWHLTEIMMLPKARWDFIGYRPAGAFANNINLVRSDGSVNNQLVCVAGSYTQAEIDTWKASVGYSGSEIRWPCPGTGVEAQIDAEMAVFYTFDETVTARIDLIVNEIGDIASKLREV